MNVGRELCVTFVREEPIVGLLVPAVALLFEGRSTPEKPD